MVRSNGLTYLGRILVESLLFKESRNAKDDSCPSVRRKVFLGLKNVEENRDTPLDNK